MKIIIATTFRDFKGTDNDKIQHAFLENLKHQTYSDFQLVVTTFGEKQVERVVKEYLGDRVIVRNAIVPEGCRFSLTDVLLNGMDVAWNVAKPSILIWCTCDVMLRPEFFKVLIDNYRPNFAGIVHPNVIYATLENYENDMGRFESPADGIDFMFFDACVLELARRDIENYRFLDWGVFEWFLGLISLRYAEQRINLCGVTTIGKISNNRRLTDESLLYFGNCYKKNKPVLERYIYDTKIVRRYSEAIGLNCHLRYEMLKPIEGYQDMLKTIKRNQLKNWFFGKMRGFRCRVLRAFSNKV